MDFTRKGACMRNRRWSSARRHEVPHRRTVRTRTLASRRTVRTRTLARGPLLHMARGRLMARGRQGNGLQDPYLTRHTGRRNFSVRIRHFARTARCFRHALCWHPRQRRTKPSQSTRQKKTDSSRQSLVNNLSQNSDGPNTFQCTYADSTHLAIR